MLGLSLYPFQLDKTDTTSFTANEQHLAYVEAIFGCSGLVFPGGITSVILPFSLCWDADLVTRGDTVAGTAGGGELSFFFNVGVSGVVPSTISALTRLRVGTTSTFVCVSTMNKDLRVSYKHPLGKNPLQLQIKLLNSGFLPYTVFHVIKYSTGIDCYAVLMN